MVKYRNVQTGREVERPSEDKWLEASSGWERTETPVTKPSGEIKDEGSKD